tara:strand:- start:2001 stop:2282 length:282 start_codon:yes stop_codon:yes gene_type:complete
MDSQLPSNQEQPQPKITVEQLQQMKEMARQQAIQQVVGQRQIEQPQQIVYVRRNLTVAEVIAVFVISCGLVFGIQIGWNFATNVLPRIEIKVN